MVGSPNLPRVYTSVHSHSRVVVVVVVVVVWMVVVVVVVVVPGSNDDEGSRTSINQSGI